MAPGLHTAQGLCATPSHCRSTPTPLAGIVHVCCHGQEPEVLKSEKEQLDRSLQTTAVSQYTAFLDAANCLTSISNELSAVCENLEALLQVGDLRAWNLDCL